MLLGVANHFYKSDPSEYLLLRIDPALLEDAHVKYEAAAPVGETEAHKTEGEVLFPHIYGALNVTSVTEVFAVKRDSDGTFLEIEGL
mmetsp:Transcript_5859/g.8641  ORF Transcript_5859/g.8641 Transcript_5859/m.8641 type:complete len:87 (+) Transcript_5859:67-327(+)